MDTLKYFDFNIICRICLSKTGKTYFTDAAILYIIHKLTDLDFRTDDLPQQICQKCLDKINDICEFSFQCIRSHSALIECLNQQKNPEPKKVEEETATNSDIFETFDRLKTEELKEEILDLKHDVIYFEEEVEKVSTTNFEINESLDNLVTEELQVNILVPNAKEVTKNKSLDSENDLGLNNDERPYKCEKCCKAFFKKSRLTQHKVVHSDIRPYKCKQCSIAFKLQSALQRHERIHSGERPYKCDQCSKTFSQSSTLRRHKRIHGTKRPYKCDQCPKAFNQLSNMYRHKRLHSDV